MKSAHQIFKSAIESNASDDDLRSKFQTLHDLKSKMAELRFNQMLEIRSILTDEQKTKFKGFQKMIGGGGRQEHKRRGIFGRGGGSSSAPKPSGDEGDGF
jgi:Spy/CpxP family protein refolding chaperone